MQQIKNKTSLHWTLDLMYIKEVSLTIRKLLDIPNITPSIHYVSGVKDCDLLFTFKVLLAHKSALEMTQLSNVLITDNLFWSPIIVLHTIETNYR